jgi:hypothetical protein
MITKTEINKHLRRFIKNRFEFEINLQDNLILKCYRFGWTPDDMEYRDFNGKPLILEIIDPNMQKYPSYKNGVLDKVKYIYDGDRDKFLSILAKDPDILFRFEEATLLGI